MHLNEEILKPSLILHSFKYFTVFIYLSDGYGVGLSWLGNHSSLSLCRRLLDLLFCVLLFRKLVLPPSSPPSEVMTRSLNLCLGSGGSVSAGVLTLSSTCGSCRSTFALWKKNPVSRVCTFSALQFAHPLGHSLGVLLLLDLLPGSVWVCSFFPFGLCCLFLLLLLLLLLQFC